jgi:[ribosomal protein S18]-alanine N-acetyltransferase
VILRAASGVDAAGVAELEQDLFGADAWSLPMVVAEIAAADRFAAVAMADDTLLGYAVTMRVGDVVDLQRIGVHPSHRRAGVARALLDVAVQQADADGAHAMLLEVSRANGSAIAFYLAEGFVEIDRRRRYYRDGSDALVLRRPLRASRTGAGG